MNRGLSIYSMFTTVLFLAVIFMMFWLRLARDRQGISLMVFGYNRYNSYTNRGDGALQVKEGGKGTTYSSLEQGSEFVSFEKKDKLKKIIIIAYPRNLFKHF